MPDSFTPRGAAIELDRSLRTIWRLLETGDLARADGAPVRITQESINLYLAKKTTDTLVSCHLNCHKDSGFDKAVARIIKLVPALSEPSAAAKRLGIPCKTFERLVDSGAVPTVEIGPSRFIPGRWLSEKLAEGYGLRPGEGKA